MPIKMGYDTQYISNRKIHNIDIQVISASRPKHLFKMIKSFDRCIVTHAKLKKMIHEDVIGTDPSYINNFHWFDEIHVSNPPIGNARSMDFMIHKWQTPYVFHLQDDWEFELPIDLDRILWTMDNNPKINCIFFNKQLNRHWMEKFEQDEVDFDGLKVCKSYFWPFLPGIWRTKVFKEKWSFREDRPEGFFNKQFGKTEERKQLAKEDKFGVYMLGEMFHPRYVRHIGENLSRVPWRKNRDDVKFSLDDTRSRAPWLPKPEEQP